MYPSNEQVAAIVASHSCTVLQDAAKYTTRNGCDVAEPFNCIEKMITLLYEIISLAQ